MNGVTEAIHHHHQELTGRLLAHVAALEENGPEADAEALAEFLKTELLPHAHGEEEHLYPALDSVLRAHGTPTATMRVDHEFIEGYARQIAEITRALKVSGAGEHAGLRQRLTRLALQLEALLQVHLEKEERIYLPLFEPYVSEQEQQRILAAMHEAPDKEAQEKTGQDAVQTVDVRPLPPAHRHAQIFAVFDSLKPGTAFILVNDHDPKPLFYQLKFEYKGQLIWDYLEAGPEAWRVRVGKGA